jgi:uncharacterized glyoxalase superfamily protein PhnB
MKLVNARIVTRDVPGLTTFYESVTGVAPVGSEEHVEFHLRGATLAICSASVIRLFERHAGTTVTNRSIILDFEVDDVDLERTRLDGIVSDWILEPKTQPWGNRTMMFRDPDGNPVDVFSRPSTRPKPPGGWA